MASTALRWYDLFTVRSDDTDGRWIAKISIAEVYGMPQSPDYFTKALVAQALGLGDVQRLFYTCFPYDAYIDVYDSASGFITHRLRRSVAAKAEDRVEKQCPQCGMLASQGSFVRSALLCREHGFLFGGC